MTTDVRLLSFDGLSEDTHFVGTVAHCAGRAGLTLTSHGFTSLIPLRKQFLEPAYMHVLTTHGGPDPGVDSQEWGFSSGLADGAPRITVGDLIPKGAKIPTRILYVAACHGDPDLWQPYLEDGAVVVTLAGKARYSAFEQIVRRVVPQIKALHKNSASSAEIERVWRDAKARAEDVTTSLRASEIGFAFG